MGPFHADRWRRLNAIFDKALDLPPDQRSEWLDAACAGEPALRADVERLLRADEKPGGVLDRNPHNFVRAALAARDSLEAEFGRFLPGAILSGRYRLVSLLGRGGMGEVYRADDLKLGHPVALKFLPSHLRDNPDLVQHLLREARITREVSHPNVCRVYDVGESDGQTFLTMEFIDGEDLRSLLARIGHLPQRKALDIARQLCAGLQAAHDLGVLHRDLKPANVMLDGRGRVRVTDFGIAATAMDVGAAAMQAGTPAYMAPEQLDGQSATPRSDVYALGLVLYELFTGSPAFAARTIETLHRSGEGLRPIRPTEHVKDLDAAIEKTILACLESDPALRPATPRAVGDALPGGDPIHSATEAGETPSPELVAASGPEGVIRPAQALGTLAGIFAMLAILMLLANRASVIGWVQWPSGPAGLENHARGILQRLGHDPGHVDAAMSLTAFNDPYRRYVRAHDPSSRRWDVLRDPGQWDALFWYRQAPRVLAPRNSAARVSSDDPTPLGGDATLLTDLQGNLIWMEVVPQDAEPPSKGMPPVDWTRLFREAGLDLARFEPADPTRNPQVAFDVQRAWSGTAAGTSGDYPIRVEAAAHRGRPVYFEQVVPWDTYWNVNAERQTPRPLTRLTTRMFRVTGIMWLIVMPVIALSLVWRNWMSGRGDRRSAFRLAAVVFCLRLSIWVFGGHHVPSLGEEWILFTIALGKSLADGAASWIMYLALEPYARRLHARFLVSWNRLLLRGRFRDPLVGRDILAGVALATVAIACWELPIVIPHAVGSATPPPPMFFPLGSLPYLYFLNAPSPEPLLGGRYALEAFAGAALSALGAAMVYLIVLLGLHLLFRRFWLALTIYAALLLFMNPVAEAADYGIVGIACSFALVLVFVSVLRFGLVGTIALAFSFLLWMNFPVTSTISAPHFGTGLIAVLAIAGLGTLGAVNASRRYRSA